VDDVVVTLELESLQDLYRKSSNQSGRNSYKVILFDEFVKIHAEQLKRQKQVLSEDGVV